MDNECIHTVPHLNHTPYMENSNDATMEMDNDVLGGSSI